MLLFGSGVVGFSSNSSCKDAPCSRIILIMSAVQIQTDLNQWKIILNTKKKENSEISRFGHWWIDNPKDFTHLSKSWIFKGHLCEQKDIIFIYILIKFEIASIPLRSPMWLSTLKFSYLQRIRSMNKQHTD